MVQGLVDSDVGFTFDFKYNMKLPCNMKSFPGGLDDKESVCNAGEPKFDGCSPPLPGRRQAVGCLVGQAESGVTGPPLAGLPPSSATRKHGCLEDLPVTSNWVPKN